MIRNLPISKSIANRLLILHAMQDKPLVLHYEEKDLCDDVLLLRTALLQIQSLQQVASTQPHGILTLNLQNCGTAMRFLTAYCAVKEGLEVILTGVERMQERPIGQLVEALRSAGADVEYLGEKGFPPLHIRGKTLPRVPITLNNVDSSQFISALMLVGFPVETNETSPYIEMTQALIEEMQKGERITIERDWSSASYWYEYVALYGGEIVFPDLSFQTLQGDCAVVDIFERFGVKTEEISGGIRIYKDIHATPFAPQGELNFSSCPDLYPAVYVTGYKLGITLHATGTERLLHKESNRLKAFEQLDDPAASIKKSYGDHRIAMALLVAGYQVDDIQCISKSYPQFVEQLRNVTFVIPHRNQESGIRNQESCVLRVWDEGKGKKWALRKGVEQTATEYVWLTDDDVAREYYPLFVPPTLLGDLTILPLRMQAVSEKQTILSPLQQIEYEALQSLTIWAAERGHAVMCSGANMIVNRKRWLESYDDLHLDIPSGDDMFLLESFKRRKLQVHPLYHPEYIATVQPVNTWGAFFRQRMRWAGKAPQYTDKDILLCGGVTVMANLLVLLCPLLVICKYPFDLYFIRQAHHYNLTNQHVSSTTALWTLLLSLIYPWYMIICLLGGLIRKNKW